MLIGNSKVFQTPETAYWHGNIPSEIQAELFSQTKKSIQKIVNQV